MFFHGDLGAGKTKFTEGFYVLVNFKASADLPKELDRNLKINENVIRHMIVCA